MRVRQGVDSLKKGTADGECTRCGFIEERYGVRVWDPGIHCPPAPLRYAPLRGGDIYKVWVLSRLMTSVLISEVMEDSSDEMMREDERTGMVEVVGVAGVMV